MADRTGAAESRTHEVAEALYSVGATVIRGIPRDISLTAVSTLATLERTGPRRITDLALVQGVAQPSMTSLVTGLEKLGYVERRGDESDRRVALVALTDSGARILHDRRRAGADSVASLLAKLDAADRTLLEAALPALQRLRQLDEQQREPR